MAHSPESTATAQLAVAATLLIEARLRGISREPRGDNHVTRWATLRIEARLHRVRGRVRARARARVRGRSVWVRVRARLRVSRHWVGLRLEFGFRAGFGLGVGFGLGCAPHEQRVEDEISQPELNVITLVDQPWLAVG